MSDATGSIMDDVVSARRAQRELLRDEYRAVFEATYPRLVRTLWFVVHDQALAEEVAQEAFAELYRKWASVRDYERVDLWVRRVAIRRARRELARAARRRRLEQAAPRATVTEFPPYGADPELLAAIRALPARQRAVVVLFYLEDRPMAEVADALGCSTASGYVHLHRARGRLAALLSEEVTGDVR